MGGERKIKVLVSACLAGEQCRFDGTACTCEGVGTLAEAADLVRVCPEVLGGLPVPRKPSERLGERVIASDGKDVTESFRRGAVRAVEIACEQGCAFALLKERSPSCGCSTIYDGTFSGVLVEGNGTAAEALLDAGVRVYGESEIETLRVQLGAE